jgi:hypothetical protein
VVVANSLVIANWFVAVGTVALAAGTLIVALVTRSTAAATGKLAAETRDLVAATEKLSEVSAEEVELSRRAIEAEVKPLIVDWPTDNRRVTVNPGAEWPMVVVVPAMNATATALIQSVTMHWLESGLPNSEAIYQGRPTVLAVGPGGGLEARFVFDATNARRIESIEKFWVEIKYTDAAGGQPEITRLDVYWARDTENWYVWAVSFRRVGEDKPYVEARPLNR